MCVLKTCQQGPLKIEYPIKEDQDYVPNGNRVAVLLMCQGVENESILYHCQESFRVVESRM